MDCYWYIGFRCHGQSLETLGKARKSTEGRKSSQITFSSKKGKGTKGSHSYVQTEWWQGSAPEILSRFSSALRGWVKPSYNRHRLDCSEAVSERWGETQVGESSGPELLVNDLPFVLKARMRLFRETSDQAISQPSVKFALHDNS